MLFFLSFLGRFLAEKTSRPYFIYTLRLSPLSSPLLFLSSLLHLLSHPPSPSLSFTFHYAIPTPISHPGLPIPSVYTATVNILFILLIFAATLESIVRSPISTISPPRISGLTFVMTFSFLPCEYSDFPMAVSRRWRSLLSSFYHRGQSRPGETVEDEVVSIIHEE